MGKEQCSSYCIFRSSSEGYWRSLKKKKKIVQGRSWNGYCQFPARGRDLVWRSRHAEVATRSGVATWSAFVGQKRCRDMDSMSRLGRLWGRLRPGILVSRPGNPTMGRNDVATPI